MNATHYQTGSSSVRCGAKMRGAFNAAGWDLGDVTVNWSRVTCPRCLGTPTPCAVDESGGLAPRPVTSAPRVAEKGPEVGGRMGAALAALGNETSARRLRAADALVSARRAGGGAS